MSEIKHIVLLGGGKLFLNAAREIKKRYPKISLSLLCAPRHLKDLIEGVSLEDQLNSEGFSFKSLVKLSREDVASLEINLTESIALSFGAAWIIKQDIIDLFSNKIYNFHGTRLPLNRGGGGLSWQMLTGLTQGMCLVHKVDVGVDTGEIIDYQEFIYPDFKKPVDFIEYHKKKFLEFSVGFVESLLSGREYEPSGQPEYLSSYWPRLSTEVHGWVDWSWSAEEIFRFICAFDDPYVGAHTILNGEKVYLKDASIDRAEGGFHPFQYGIVLRVQSNFVVVAAKEGALILKQVLNENGEAVFIKPGDRLFTPRDLLEEALMKRVVYKPTI